MYILSFERWNIRKSVWEVDEKQDISLLWSKVRCSIAYHIHFRLPTLYCADDGCETHGDLHTLLLIKVYYLDPLTINLLTCS